MFIAGTAQQAADRLHRQEQGVGSTHSDSNLQKENIRGVDSVPKSAGKRKSSLQRLQKAFERTVQGIITGNPGVCKDPCFRVVPRPDCSAPPSGRPEAVRGGRCSARQGPLTGSTFLSRLGELVGLVGMSRRGLGWASSREDLGASAPHCKQRFGGSMYGLPKADAAWRIGINWKTWQPNPSLGTLKPSRIACGHSSQASWPSREVDKVRRLLELQLSRVL